MSFITMLRAGPEVSSVKNDTKRETLFPFPTVSTPHFLVTTHKLTERISHRVSDNSSYENQKA